MCQQMQTERVRIRAESIELEGTLRLPEVRAGVVLFAHGGAGNRLSPSNDYVGSILRAARFATLWVDLLAPHEMRNLHTRFDVPLLTKRLDAACDWLRQQEETRDLPLGLFGAGHASAAALQSAASRGSEIAGIVSRGGRPDLAGQHALARIAAPTLLIVGGLDEAVIQMNRTAYASLRCKKRFEIIPGATHLFEEPGNLEVVARLARSWFQSHFHTRASSLYA